MTKKLYRIRFRDIASIDDYYLNYNTVTKSWYIDSILENEMIYELHLLRKNWKKQVLGGYLIAYLQKLGSYCK